MYTARLVIETALSYTVTLGVDGRRQLPGSMRRLAENNVLRDGVVNNAEGAVGSWRASWRHFTVFMRVRRSGKIRSTDFFPPEIDVDGRQGGTHIYMLHKQAVIEGEFCARWPDLRGRAQLVSGDELNQCALLRRESETTFRIASARNAFSAIYFWHSRY